MQQLVNEILIFLHTLVSNSPIVISIFLGMLIIAMESIIPILPLGVFIALNMILFGNALGFIISWIATIIGCIISFVFTRNLFYKRVEKKFKDNEKFRIITKKINKLNFSNLVLITALPFTPAFLINIAAGLSNMNFKKFVFAILIAKLAVVYFWGFIGTTFLQSVTDINVIIKLALILFGAFILSKIIMKYFKLSERQ